MIWRRLRVGHGTSMADLHQTIQIAMDWDDADYSFHIYGKDFGLSWPSAHETVQNGKIFNRSRF